jgi:N-terminal acetyltransferase B complex non-catalytic subunit
MSTGNKLIDSALEANNFTLALKLVEKKIKENPSSSHNLACKCYILANAALSSDSKVNVDEALKSSIELANKIPSSSNTLELLEITFKLLDYTPKDDLYEAAIRKYQTPGLAYEWFKKTVDNNDIIGMQKATMSLSKGFKVDSDNGKMIKLWAAATMNLVLDCCNDDRLSNKKDSLLVMLGLKIMESVEQVCSNGLNAQEMYIKANLLLKNNNYEKCLSELKQFLKKESDLELLLLYFNTLKENKEWKELYDASVNYLVNIGVDDWDTWKLAILAAGKMSTDEDYKAIGEIIDSYKVTRNSQLAKIEFISADDIFGRKEAIGNYLNLFMDKLCCYLDLREYLTNRKTIEEAEKHEIFPSFTNNIAASEILQLLDIQLKRRDLDSVFNGKRKATTKDLNVLVNYIKIKLNVKPELLETKEFFKECCNLYEITKHLQKNLADFDYFAGFEFIILAVQSYLTLKKDLVETQTFLNLIIIFENSLIKNKYEFHLQLWLAKCYSNTNMSLPLKRIFENLKIKNVQIDTLGAYFINHSSSKTRNNDLISTADKFYSHNVTMELPPMVMSCFEHCTFSKLKGFIEFKIRVENSIFHYEIITEVIQNLRLNKKQSLDTIVLDYIPILKNAYNKIILNGETVDTKLHDNIDRKILWACGDHTVHDLIQNTIDTEFNKIYDAQYVEILVLRDLIIYDQHSRVWNDYRERFLEILKNNNNLASFSKIEQSLLHTLAYLLDKSITTKPELPVEPTDPLAASFNNYYLSIQDFERILATIIKQSSESVYFGDKKNRAKLDDIQKVFKNLCRAVQRDELIVMAKESLKKSKSAAQEWFINDEFGKLFNIPVEVVNKCYNNFEKDILTSIREI